MQRLKVPCNTKNLKQIRKFIIDSLKKWEIKDGELNLIVLAIDEVCSNLIIHSNNCNNAQEIELSIDTQTYPEGLVFEIKDKGVAFDYECYAEPSINELIQNQKKGGMGIMLVKKIMDKIEFESTTSQNTYRLFKKVSHFSTVGC